MNWKVKVDKMISVSVLTIASTIVFSYVCQGKDARSLVEFSAKIYPFKLKKNGAVKFTCNVSGSSIDLVIYKGLSNSN